MNALNFSDNSDIRAIDRHTRIQTFKDFLNKDNKISIPREEFYKLAQEKVKVTREEAETLLEQFNNSADVLILPDNEALKELVILKPHLITNRLLQHLNVDVVEQEIEMRRDSLLQLEKDLIPLRRVKEECDRKAAKSVNRILWGGLGYLCTQSFILAKMTWIDYGWDVVEPITYFVTFTTAMGGYIYFSLQKRDYTYESATEVILHKRRLKFYKQANFDFEKYQELAKQYNYTVSQIEANIKLVHGMVPLKCEELLHDIKEQALKEYQERKVSPSSVLH
ncbi:predicted protein [Naegleria gruberi]|uniref:Predicted protein n=1 Tax=Naegleria gruberi TaxID=5762 RepID=D2VDA7_NAEGR|nr:uncharacterized protein NAEGRDRAFT_48567 [Naegleria gruberi]EFC45109.1 predicted protein [Naegleria gruberi]|eukprot:XP_002677853.1 predicted protein [Naegleria gruberi strain NEG-M]